MKETRIADSFTLYTQTHTFSNRDEMLKQNKIDNKKTQQNQTRKRNQSNCNVHFKFVTFEYKHIYLRARANNLYYCQANERERENVKKEVIDSRRFGSSSFY